MLAAVPLAFEAGERFTTEDTEEDKDAIKTFLILWVFSVSSVVNLLRRFLKETPYSPFLIYDSRVQASDVF